MIPRPDSDAWLPEDKNDWDLYNIPGAAGAARRMTRSLFTQVNRLLTRRAKFKNRAEIETAVFKAAVRVQKVLHRLGDYGACDTEPGSILAEVFENVALQDLGVDVEIDRFKVSCSARPSIRS